MPTQPGWQQVLYAVSGVIVARSDHNSWTLPPHRALCIGDDRRVRIFTKRPTGVRVLYFDPSLKALQPTVRVVSVQPLTRELLLRAVDVSPLDLTNEHEAALYRLVVDEITISTTVPLQLPLPSDSRLRELAERILAAPADSLDSHISHIPAARRTCERLMKAQTGLTLGEWQRRARVLAAIELLAQDATVTATALAVGYSTPSSFVVAFRSETGTTPTKFLHQP